GSRVELPTYAFQRRRYWLDGTAGAADVAAAGLGASDHPLLRAAVALAGEDAWLFTGRVSRATHAWLRDHTVLGTVVVPGTALVEIDFLYDRLAELGLAYGPAFQAVRAAWRRGEELLVEVALGEDYAGAAASFGLHPALLDSAFHPSVVESEPGNLVLPFAWR